MLEERSTLFVFSTAEIEFSRSCKEQFLIPALIPTLFGKIKLPKLNNFKLGNCILFFNGYNWIYTLTPDVKDFFHKMKCEK